MRWFVNRKHIDVKEINGIITNLVRRLLGISWAVLCLGPCCLGLCHVLESAWRMGAEWMGALAFYWESIMLVLRCMSANRGSVL